MPGFELLGNEEKTEINNIIDNGFVLFRHGFPDQRNDIYKTAEFEAAFSKKLGVKYATGVTSGTSALRVALAALDIKDGDEVITQSFTFVATVEAILESKATPVIAAIDDTLNMDPEDLERKISPKTKAIILVHMLGTPGYLDKIKAIADKHGVPLMEDTAWGLGGSYQEKPLGTHGTLGTFSFDYAKAMTTGEGGMVITNDLTLHKKASAFQDHGHENVPDVPRCDDNCLGAGFNFRMNELQGAIGLAQLKKLTSIIEKQREHALLIWEQLKDIPGLSKRLAPESAYETYDSLIVRMETPEITSKCKRVLTEEGFPTKILPEAVFWHFAGEWKHLLSEEEFTKNNGFQTCREKLSCCISIPIVLNMDPAFPKNISTAFRKALS